MSETLLDLVGRVITDVLLCPQLAPTVGPTKLTWTKKTDSNNNQVPSHNGKGYRH